MHRLRIIPLVILIALSAACSDDKRTITDPVDTGYVTADTPDALMVNFVRAYEERNIVEYEKLLHDDFEFTFTAEDVTELGLPSPIWDRLTELAATQRMFDGSMGVDPISGQPTPAITNIALSLDKVTEWTTANDGDPRYEGTQHRVYRVTMRVTLEGTEDQRIGGHQDFYVVENDGVFQMKAWNEVGWSIKSKSNESESWGSIKVLY